MVVATVLVMAGTCWAVLAVVRSSAQGAERTETVRLLAQAKLIRGAIEPIARDYTSRPDSATIDVAAFAKRLSDARRVVDGVNEIEIVTDEGLRESLGRAGRARAAALFRREDAIDRYEDHYRRLLGAQPREAK